MLLTLTVAAILTGVGLAEDYKPDWESLSRHEAAPEWFKDAKLGIYFHWGAYAVPAYGSEWYPRNMFLKDQKKVLEELGDWLKSNGEAIYATRPWKTFGEGPTVEPEGGFKDHQKFLRLEYSAKDMRFTQSKDGKTVYVIILGWPEGPVTLSSAKVVAAGSDAKVELLGATGAPQYSIDDSGRLTVQPPQLPEDQRPGKFAYSLKLTGFELESAK